MKTAVAKNLKERAVIIMCKVITSITELFQLIRIRITWAPRPTTNIIKEALLTGMIKMRGRLAKVRKVESVARCACLINSNSNSINGSRLRPIWAKWLITRQVTYPSPKSCILAWHRAAAQKTNWNFIKLSEVEARTRKMEAYHSWASWTVQVWSSNNSQRVPSFP